MRSQDSFLGTGWSFPIHFERSENIILSTVKMVKVEEDIVQSLTILFSTSPGERVMRSNYGCSLEDLLFEPISPSLDTYIKELITNAILFYEPRIVLEDIHIKTQESLDGKITIELTFRVRATNSRLNFVYDYYKGEATVTSSISQPN